MIKNFFKNFSLGAAWVSTITFIVLAFTALGLTPKDEYDILTLRGGAFAAYVTFCVILIPLVISIFAYKFAKKLFNKKAEKDEQKEAEIKKRKEEERNNFSRNFEELGFVISNSAKSGNTTLALDSEHKKWLIAYSNDDYRIFSYDELISYKLDEAEKTILMENVDAALLGVNGNRSTKKMCESMSLLITDSKAGVHKISLYWGTPIDKSSLEYSSVKNTAQRMTAMLDVILKSNEDSKIRNQQQSVPAQPSLSASTEEKVESVKKYKELLDIGAITQEEYDKKKKELLDL